MVDEITDAVEIEVVEEMTGDISDFIIKVQSRYR